MADFIDRKALRSTLSGIMVEHGIVSPPPLPSVEACDAIIDAVLDAVGSAAVSKGMDFARGLLAKRKGDDQ